MAIRMCKSFLKESLVPKPLDKDESYRITKLLRTVCQSVIVMCSLLMTIWWMVISPSVFRLTLIHGLSIICLAFSVLYALYMQRIHAARMTAALGAWAMAIFGVILYGGVSTPMFTSLLPLAILVAGFLATPRLASVLSGVSIVLGLLFMWLEQVGYISSVIQPAESSLYNYALTLPAICLVPIVTHFAELSYRTVMQKYKESESARHKNEITKLKNAQLSTQVREQQRVGEALRIAKEAAEQGERAKGQFLATMSHEIRTPMNAVIGMTNLLLESDVDDDVRNSLKIIQDSSESLLTIINDILDYSKIEHGGMELEQQPVNLLDCINSSLVSVSYQAQSKQLPINIHIDDNTPAVILTDGGRFRQILVNLLANAVKFTETGHIDLKVSCQLVDAAKPVNPTRATATEHSGEQVEAHYTLQVEVQDTGIGISQENIQKLFRPFSQADASHTRRFGGSGLGLMISMKLAELMGGEMWVESVEGEGSSFFFTIRTHQTQMAVKEEPISGSEGAYLSASHPLSILLVEDNVVNQKVATMMLKKLGYDIDIANNGLEALDCITTKQYDLVLMDIHMPEMDGLEATSEIKKRLPAKQQPRIVAMTASAMKEDKIQAYSVGMNAFLSKPVRKPELIAILDSTKRVDDSHATRNDSQIAHRYVAQQAQDPPVELSSAPVTNQPRESLK